MNSAFENFSYEHVEKYMKRSLAYGMFPGFFSHNASQGHYFTRPELYDHDRELFKKYVPLCRLVAEAGWEPVTGARSENEGVHVERYGERYLTVFNDTDRPQNADITIDAGTTGPASDLVTGHTVNFQNGKATITLGPEDVAVVRLE